MTVQNLGEMLKLKYTKETDDIWISLSNFGELYKLIFVCKAAQMVLSNIFHLIFLESTTKDSWKINLSCKCHTFYQPDSQPFSLQY